MFALGKSGGPRQTKLGTHSTTPAPGKLSASASRKVASRPSWAACCRDTHRALQPTRQRCDHRNVPSLLPPLRPGVCNEAPQPLPQGSEKQQRPSQAPVALPLTPSSQHRKGTKGTRATGRSPPQPGPWLRRWGSVTARPQGQLLRSHHRGRFGGESEMCAENLRWKTSRQRWPIRLFSFAKGNVPAAEI